MSFSTFNETYDDGTKFPDKIEFTEVSWSPETRTYNGTIDLGPKKYQNESQIWKFELEFKSSYEFIKRGEITKFARNGSNEEYWPILSSFKIAHQSHTHKSQFVYQSIQTRNIGIPIQFEGYLDTFEDYWVGARNVSQIAVNNNQGTVPLCKQSSDTNCYNAFNKIDMPRHFNIYLIPTKQPLSQMAYLPSVSITASSVKLNVSAKKDERGIHKQFYEHDLVVNSHAFTKDQQKVNI